MLIDFNLQENLLFEFYLWTTYYCNHIGFGLEKSAFVSFSLPIGMTVGSLFITPLINLNPSKIWISTILLLTMGLFSFTGLGFLNDDPENFALYLIFFTLGEMFLVAPYSLSITS